MEREAYPGTENLEAAIQTSDLLSVPEGAREYVDLIGDENLDSFGKPDSDSEQ